MAVAQVEPHLDPTAYDPKLDNMAESFCSAGQHINMAAWANLSKQPPAAGALALRKLTVETSDACPPTSISHAQQPLRAENK